MPTYQYVCTQCGQDLEVQQSFSDASLTECPACAGRLRKVFNAVGVVFKGSGFYRNDSRSGSSTDSKDSSKDGDSKDGGSKESKDSGSKSPESTATKDSGSKSSDSTTKKSDASSSSTSKAPASTT